MKAPRPIIPETRFGIWLRFFLIGPFIGWLIAAPILIVNAATSSQTKDFPVFVLATLTMGLPISYALGLLPAVAAGAVLVALEAGYKTPTVTVALLIGIAVGLIAVGCFHQTRPPNAEPVVLVAMFAASAISAPATWYILRFRKRAAT